MTAKTNPFKTFPEFSKLTLADKEAYERIIADYPAITDISFSGLMIWWNFLDTCAVSELNDNLVISYWLPGVEEYSGLSILGTHKIDESVCTIFDYLRAKGEAPRLVHVSEFVMSNMKYPELFSFIAERNFDEYIVPISRLYPLSQAVSHRRVRIKKFLADVDESRIIIKSLNLAAPENKQLLFDSAEAWWSKHTVNELLLIEKEAMEVAIGQAEGLGVENVCIYIDGELHAFCLFQLALDKRYALISHAKVNDKIPYTFDYLTYAMARWFADKGITYVNLDCDLGLPFMRMIKLSLGPTNSFRKYIVEPARGSGED